MNKFYELYDLLNEKKDLNIQKVIKMKSMDVQVTAYSNHNDRNTLYMKSLKDPNIKGKIAFETEEDLKLMFGNLKDSIELLNYINYNYKTNSDAYKLSSILTREISALKKDLTPEEYDDLGLEFDIKSQLEKEIEAQAKLADAQPEVAPQEDKEITI